MFDPYAALGHFVFGMVKAWGTFLVLYLLIHFGRMLYEKIKEKIKHENA